MDRYSVTARMYKDKYNGNWIALADHEAAMKAKDERVAELLARVRELEGQVKEAYIEGYRAFKAWQSAEESYASSVARELIVSHHVISKGTP